MAPHVDESTDHYSLSYRHICVREASANESVDVLKQIALSDIEHEEFTSQGSDVLSHAMKHAIYERLWVDVSGHHVGGSQEVSLFLKLTGKVDMRCIPFDDCPAMLVYWDLC